MSAVIKLFNWIFRDVKNIGYVKCTKKISRNKCVVRMKLGNN